MPEALPELHGGDGADYRTAGAVLTVDLDALAANYRGLAKASAPAEAAGVVKADAYGLGASRVVPALTAAGCKRFFVALPEEGLAVRALAAEAEILVLGGLLSADIAGIFAQAHLTPVLNSHRDIAAWEAHCGATGAAHPCAIHVDTGMNRLGLTPAEAIAFVEDNALTGAIRPTLLMSHLACADQPRHPMNRAQVESFQVVRAAFGEIESSIANSAGIFLGADFRFDLTRPGIALYGGAPIPGVANPMRPVATLEARIVQVRYARAGETVSYGATARLARDTIVAVAALGYGDGWHRAGSGSGVPLRDALPEGGCGFVAGRRVPILGRVTMDLTMFDVTDIGENGVMQGDLVELFGPNLPIDDAAAAAGTVAYEMLTSIGRRYQRRYVGGQVPVEE